MEGLSLLAIGLAGALAGVLTGLIPGIHVNTLAALALALIPNAAPPLALFLVAVGVAHTFVSIIPATYLGAPGEDTIISMLPAHRLLYEGKAPAAIHTSVHASLLGLLGAILLLWPLRWILGRPLNLFDQLNAVAPWLLGATLLVLLVQEALRGARRLPPTALVMGLAAWLGLMAFEWPTSAFLNVPSTPLLPLLAGLFGVPSLVAAIHSGTSTPLQDPAPAWDAPSKFRPRDILPGLGITTFSAALPGVTGAVSTSIARIGRRTDDPNGVLATLSVVNTAHAILAMGMLWIVGRTRSGLGQAVQSLWYPQPWTIGTPPLSLMTLVCVILIAGIMGAAGTLWLERPFRLLIEWLPTRAPTTIGIAMLLALTVLLTGATGLLLLAIAALVGTIPLRCGIRRIHLIAALIVPIMVRIA